MPKARETCTECSLRRQKCDKKIPCGRCVKRGKADACTRQWTNHRGVHYAVPVLIPGEGRRSTRSPVVRNNVGRRTISSITESDDEEVADVVTENNNSNNDNISTLDFMTWKPSEVEAPINHEHHNLFGLPKMNKSNALDGQISGINLLQILLPNVGQMWKLINFHEKKLLWYHGCYHGPTFNTQVEERLAQQAANEDDVLQIQGHDLQWIALLFSIIAGSLTSASEMLLSDWGFSTAESPQLCVQWYGAAITALKLANFTSDHNILGAQAIATLTMCAHTLGFSGDLHVHLGAALRIVQSLNLHRIRNDDAEITADSSVEVRRAILKKEIGRRLWSQLCIQDWFSIPLAEAHSIHRGHFTTKKPGNRNHITMEILDQATPTYISYGNYLYEIAALIAEMHARNISLNTDYTRYQLVLDYDTRMRQLATAGRPHYFDMNVHIEASWPWFVPWARRSLTICFAHKIMMIHRAFLKRSFTNEAFSFTRRTCIAASKTILNEARIERRQDEPIVWIDSAFCIAAAITLALDICHRDPSEPEYSAHKSLIQDCMFMLQRQANSTLARRGIRLLEILVQRSSKDSGASSNMSTLDTRRSNGNDNNGYDRGRNHAQDTSSAIPILNAIHGSDTISQIGLSNLASGNENELGQLAEMGGMSGSHLEESSIDDLFAELFPPQAGFSNAYLFEELLDLSLER